MVATDVTVWHAFIDTEEREMHNAWVESRFEGSGQIIIENENLSEVKLKNETEVYKQEVIPKIVNTNH
jgi:hypothetical protein